MILKGFLPPQQFRKKDSQEYRKRLLKWIIHLKTLLRIAQLFHLSNEDLRMYVLSGA